MLNIFLSNRVSTVFVIPILLLLFWFGSFSQPLPVNTNTTFVYELFYNMLSDYPLYNRIVGLIISVFLVFFVSRIFNANDFYNKENAVPSVVMAIMIGAWSGFHFFSPIYISLFFLLLAFDRMLNVYHQKTIIRELFDTSFLIGLAALFYYPIVLFVLTIYAYLIIARSFSFRETIIPLIGLLTPFYFLAGAFYLFDITPVFVDINTSGVFTTLIYESGLTQRFYLVITVLLIILSLFHIFKILNRAKVRVQLSRKFLLIAFLNGILVYWVSLSYYPIIESSFFLMLPAVLLIPFFFLESRNIYRKIGFYFWLIAALLFDYIAI